MIDLLGDIDIKRAPALHRFQRIGDEIQHNLLDLRPVDFCHAGLCVRELNVAVPKLTQRSHHQQHVGHNPRQVIGRANTVVAAGKIKQTSGNFAAAEGLAVNHFQIFSDVLHFRGICPGAQVLPAILNRLGRHGDCRKRIVDFVANTGRQ